MLVETLSVVRDLSRLHDITSIVIRYGGGDLVRLIGLGNLLERAGRILRWNEATELRHLEPAVRVRMALEELGPTFVKLGQVLATRVDLFPPHWIAEFEKLQSAVPPVPFETLLPEMERALGCAPGDVFRDIEPQAHAAASIAQVHRARLEDGTPVVLKVRRPAIRPKIEADLRIMSHLARLLESEIHEFRRYQPVQIVAEFAKSLRRELDLAVEARHVDRFRDNFADDPHIVVPRVYWEWTSEAMNVQEYIEGVPGTYLKAVDEAGLDRKVLATRASDAVLKMILIHGFFHADPHPGNVFYLPGNRIAMIDFGMVGYLTENRRNQIVDLLAALSRRDEQGIMEVVLDWTGEAQVDEEKLAADIASILITYDRVQLKDINVGQVLNEITAVMREHYIVVPTDLTLLFKALITLEGYGRQVDPEFRMIEHITPFVKQVILHRYAPSTLAKRGQHGLRDALAVITDLPRDLVRLVKEVRRGKFKIDLDLKRLDHFAHLLDRAIDRATIGILTASLVIGSSIVMTVQGGPTLLGIPILTVFGLLGFVIAFFNSLWIIFSIWRSGKD
ncbi:MAG: ubiquinone biosynthesis protein UbiB [Betaproteobacteria bacterium]|nr:ubiquinone biosynthesis protein UbiB [Betaproteobacteria bacterium]